MKRFVSFLMVLIISLVSMIGCGQKSSTIKPTSTLSAPTLRKTTTLRSTSEAPRGVRLTWTYVDGATGYYLYRNTSPLPEFGTIDPKYRVNNGNLIKKGDPNAVFDDKLQEVQFDDLFSAVPNTTYYYRVTAYDGVDESNPSNQIEITISPQFITNLNPATGYIGDSINIEGDYFGDVKTGSDFVYFLGVDGSDVEAKVNSWSKTKINVVVPAGIQIGKVKVVIDATIAESPMDFVVKDPFITNVSPNTGFPGDKVKITGGNFGDTQGTSTITFNKIPVVTIENWSNTSIDCFVPEGMVEGNVVVTVNSFPSNGFPFTVGVFIEKITPKKQYQDKVIQITGKHFGDKQGYGYVEFTGFKDVVPVDVVDVWTDELIKVVVPPTACDGPVRVFAGKDKNSLKTGNSVPIVVLPTIGFKTDKLGSSYDIIKVVGSGFSDKELKVKAVFSFEIPYGGDTVSVVVKPNKVNLIDPFNVTLEVPSEVGYYYPSTCKLVAIREDGISNEYPFTIDEMLTGKITGIQANKVYTLQSGVLNIELQTVKNLEKAELVIGTNRILATQVEAGKYTVNLDIATILNGKYDIFFDLYRRAINLPSETIPVYLISKQGDLDLNNKVNIDDLKVIQSNYGKTQLDDDYSPLLDANLDGVIDERDGSIIGLNYGL